MKERWAVGRFVPESTGGLSRRWVIEWSQHDDLFASGCDALVNPVNTVGVMGAGLAKQFARRYPDLLAPYQDACRSGVLHVGGAWLWAAPDGIVVACVATKKDWRNPSRIGWVRGGLIRLDAAVRRDSIDSVAVPALGAGLGGLPWDDVHRITIEVLEKSPVRYVCFTPHEARR
jgi:hypothetical protein